MTALFDWIGGFVSMLISALTAVALWIESYQFFVATIGIPILLWVVTQVLERAAERKSDADRQQMRETTELIHKLERELQRKLKLAEFRQNWINDLRSDLSSYAAYHTKAYLDFSDDDFVEMIKIGSRILMRMNKNDPDYSAIEVGVSHAVDRASVLPDGKEALKEKYGEYEPIVTVGGRILKREWERLKNELHEATS